jgi:hypothetical protein
MSKLIETKRAFEEIEELLNQKIRNGGTRAKELERHRATLQRAFFLLGFGEFERIVKTKAKEVIGEKSPQKGIDGHAWRYLKDNLKGVPLRKQLDIIFHGNEKIRSSIDDNYDIRNDIAHNSQHLPSNAADIAAWLESLEDLVDKF